MTDLYDKENVVHVSSKPHLLVKPSPLTSRSNNHSNIQTNKSSTTSSVDKPNAIQQLLRKPLTTMMSNGPPIHHSSNPTPISIRRPGLQSIFTRPMGSAQRVLQANEHVVDSDDDDDDDNAALKTTTNNLTNVSGSLSGVIHAHTSNHTSNQSTMSSPQLSNQHLNVHLNSPNHQSKITSIKSPRRSFGTLPKSPRRSIGHTGTLSTIPSAIHPSDHTLNRSLTEHTDSHSSHSSSSDQTVMTPPSALPTISVDSASPASQSSDVDMNASLSQSKSTPLSTSSSVNSSSTTVELDPATHMPVSNKVTAVRQLQLPGHANRISPPSINTPSTHQSNHLSANQPSLRSSPAKPVSNLNSHPSAPVVRTMHSMNNVMHHANNNVNQSPAPSVKLMQVCRNQMMKSTPQHSHHQLYNQHPHSNNSVQTPTLQNNNNTPSFVQHNQQHNQNNYPSDHSSNNPPPVNPPSSQSPGVYTVRGRQFRVLGPPLGKGGTSVVYRVVGMDSSNGTFALKVVRLPAEQQALINMENEIKMLSKMKSVNQCIQLYDWDIVEKPTRVLYMVMELGKEDLSQWMQRTVKEPIDPIRLREIWRSMLQCVAVCHANGILHRDLKPANFVFVGIDVKLLDFGIAATMGEEAEANETCVVSEHMTGTLNYMSPESLSQADRKYHQHRASDVWSLGCILYQLVYGVCPFAHISQVMGKMRAICDDSLPIKFSVVDPHGRPVSRYLLDVMQGCLQRDPAKRANVQSLLQHPFVNIDAACGQQIWLEKSRLRAMLAKRGIHCEDKELDEMFEELR